MEITEKNLLYRFIEFYQIHNKTSYIRSISEINNNKRLLVFEQYTEQEKKPYYSFHIPKVDRENKENSLKTIKDLLSGGKNNQFAESLHSKEKLQVDKKGKVYFFSEDGKTSEEFWKNENGEWKSKKHGKRNNFFFKSIKKGKDAVIFDSPSSFAKKGKDEISKLLSSDTSVFVLFEESERAMDNIVAGNKNLKNIQFISNKSKKSHGLFLEKLKSRYKGFDLNFSTSSSIGKTRSRDDLGISR